MIPCGLFRYSYCYLTSLHPSYVFTASPSPVWSLYSAVPLSDASYPIPDVVPRNYPGFFSFSRLCTHTWRFRVRSHKHFVRQILLLSHWIIGQVRTKRQRNFPGHTGLAGSRPGGLLFQVQDHCDPDHGDSSISCHLLVTSLQLEEKIQFTIHVSQHSNICFPILSNSAFPGHC